MSLKYLLDTNIVSEPFRQIPDSSIIRRLQQHANEVAIASVVWHELWYGCWRLPPSQKRQNLQRYLNEVVAMAIPVLPYTEKAAEWHAIERARLSQAGKTPSFADAQIAATAVIHNLILVTNNLADYADFDGLQTEDWRI